jgi:hypothetical protein
MNSHVFSVAEERRFKTGFFGIEHGRPIAAFVVYTLASLPGQRVILQCQVPGCVQVSTGDSWSNFFMGANDKIEQYGPDTRFWDSNGSDEAIRKLIAMEVAAHPDLVGGPINMISISSSEIKWIQHSHECPDIKPILKH